MISGDKVGLLEHISHNLFPMQGDTTHTLDPIRSAGWAGAGCTGCLSAQCAVACCWRRDLVPLSSQWCVQMGCRLMSKPFPCCEHQSLLLRKALLMCPTCNPCVTGDPNYLCKYSQGWRRPHATVLPGERLSNPIAYRRTSSPGITSGLCTGTKWD